MARIPSKTEILDWIAENPGLSARRDIARAFGIKGAERNGAQAAPEGAGIRGHICAAERRDVDKLPPVSVLTILAPDRDGDQFARAVEWQSEGPEPRMPFMPRKADAPVAEGDRVLARLSEVSGEDHQYEARLIRMIGTNPLKVLGIFRKGAEGGRIVAIDKGSDKEWIVEADATQGAKDGELVEADRLVEGSDGPAAGKDHRPAGRSCGAEGGVAHRHPPARHPRRLSRCGDRRGRQHEACRTRRVRGLAPSALRHHRPVGRARP